MSEQHSTDPADSDRELTVLVPDEPPVLTPEAARALLQLLVNTARRTRHSETKDGS